MQSPSLNHCLLFKCRCSLFHCGDSLWVSVIKVIHGEFEAIVNVLRSPWDTIVRDMQKIFKIKVWILLNFVFCMIGVGNERNTRIQFFDIQSGNHLFYQQFHQVFVLDCHMERFIEKIAKRWGRRRVMVGLVVVLQRFDFSKNHDKWDWLLQSSSVFSVALTQYFLDSRTLPSNEALTR